MRDGSFAILAGRAAVRPTEDVEKFVGDRFIDHLVEHVPQLDPDGLLAKPRFFQIFGSGILDPSVGF